LFKFLWTFANVSVVTGKGATAAADWSANKQLTLPDCAGRLLAGRDDLGGGAKSRITSATVTGPTLAGATGGAETVTLNSTMIPAHTHTSPAVTDPQHRHFIANTDVANIAGVTLNNSNVLEASNVSSTVAYALAGSATAANIGLTSSSSTNVSLAATTGSTGGGLAHSNMPPVMLFTIYLKL
jgi:microcystin-dependent protein